MTGPTRRGAPPPRPSRRSTTSTAARRTAASSCGCSWRGPPRRRGGALRRWRRERRRRRARRAGADGERPRLPRARRVAAAALRPPARPPRPDRHPRRLRARRLRRVHRARRRDRGALVPPVRRAGRRVRGRDRRASGRHARAHRPPAGDARAPRAAVRLLHPRRPDGGRGPARAPPERRARGRRAPARRTGLPLHRLRADHRRDHRDRGAPAVGAVNLARTLQYAAERRPDAEAVVGGGERLTYAELHERAARLAGGLARLGVEPGERVAVLLKNRVETVALYWACQWLGAWFVPLNFRLGPDEVAYCVGDAGAVAVAFDAAGAGPAAAVAADGGPRAIAVADADGGDASLAELCTAEPHPGALDRDDGEIGLMLYTSGTTGRPKGVPRSHRADRAAGLTQVVHHGLDLGDRTLGVMPLYHTMGMHSMIAMALVGGCFVALADWSPAAALALVADERLTSLYLAPTFYHDLVRDESCGETDLSGVRSLGYAGAPMSPALATRVAEAFSPRVFFNHYGSTQVSTGAIHRAQAANPGCVGRRAINARLRLVRPRADAGPDDLAEPGEDGQVICELASEEAFAASWRRPDADEAAIRDVWYSPGDTARVDDD